MLRSKVGIARKGQRPAVKIGAIALGALIFGLDRFCLELIWIVVALCPLPNVDGL